MEPDTKNPSAWDLPFDPRLVEDIRIQVTTDKNVYTFRAGDLREEMHAWIVKFFEENPPVPSDQPGGCFLVRNIPKATRQLSPNICGADAQIRFSR